MIITLCSSCGKNISNLEIKGRFINCPKCGRFTPIGGKSYNPNKAEKLKNKCLKGGHMESEEMKVQKKEVKKETPISADKKVPKSQTIRELVKNGKSDEVICKEVGVPLSYVLAVKAKKLK